MKYNKLVRDKIIDIIKASGGNPIYHEASEEEYGPKLMDKLLEEAKELIDNREIGEVADVLEVLDAICEYLGFSKTEVERIKVAKAMKRGGFHKRIILEES